MLLFCSVNVVCTSPRRLGEPHTDWNVMRKDLQQVRLGKQQLWSELQEGHPQSTALE